MPYRTMKQIWKISANPADWRSQEGSALLVIWWALWVLFSIIVANGNFGVFAILKDLFFIGATITAIKLVRTITRRQEALVARSGV